MGNQLLVKAIGWIKSRPALSVLILLGVVILAGGGIVYLSTDKKIPRSSEISTTPLVEIKEGLKKTLKSPQKPTDDTGDIQIVSLEREDKVLKDITSYLKGGIYPTHVFTNMTNALVFEHRVLNYGDKSKRVTKLNKLNLDSLVAEELTDKLLEAAKEPDLIRNTAVAYNGQIWLIGTQKIANGKSQPLLLMFDGKNIEDWTGRLVNCVPGKWGNLIGPIVAKGKKFLIQGWYMQKCLNLYDGQNFSDISANFSGGYATTFNDQNWTILKESKIHLFDGQNLKEIGWIDKSGNFSSWYSIIWDGDEWLASGLNNGQVELYAIKLDGRSEKITSLINQYRKSEYRVYYFHQNDSQILVSGTAGVSSIVLMDKKRNKGVDIYPAIKAYVGSNFNIDESSFAPWGNNWLIVAKGRLFTLETTDIDELKSRLGQ